MIVTREAGREPHRPAHGLQNLLHTCHKRKLRRPTGQSITCVYKLKPREARQRICWPGHDCVPYMATWGYAAPSVGVLAPPFPTQGSTHTLTGHDFGVGYPAVVWLLVDRVPSAPLTLAPAGTIDIVSFAVPRGTGGGHAVVLSVGGQVSAPLRFDYDAPVVTSAGLMALAAGRCVGLD